MASAGVEGTLGREGAVHRPASVAREPTPADADPAAERYCFECRAQKNSGGDGWSDVWNRGCFAWEYKCRRADLHAAFNQLRQYALALENPPLLIVSDMAQLRIRTSWANSVSGTHEFTLDDLVDGATRNKLKWAMSEPQRLRPGETRQTVTFETFLFLDDLSPDMSAADYADDPRAVAIAKAARRLVKLRGHWLNLPEWVEWTGEPAAPGYLKRAVPRDEDDAAALKSRTLTNLYNTSPQRLTDAHVALDAAAAAAYRWDTGLSEDNVLAKPITIKAAEHQS